MLSILHRHPHGLAATLVHNACITVGGVLSGIILARTLGPVGRGEVAVAVLWPTMGAVFGDFGLSFAFCYYAGKKRAEISELWTASLIASGVTGAFFCLICYVLLPLITRHASAGTATALEFGLPSTPFLIATLFEGYLLLGSGLVSEFNMTRTFSTISYTTAIILVAAFGSRTPLAFTCAFTVAQICSAVLTTYLVLKRLGVHFSISRNIWPGLLKYGFKTYLSSIAGQANLKLDQMIMSFTLPTAMLGQYVVAVALSSGLGPLSNAFATVVLPDTLYAEGMNERGRQVLKWFIFGLLAAVLIATAGVVLAPWALPLLFSNKYIRAVRSAQILLIAAVAQGSTMVLENGLRALGTPGRPAIAQAIALVLTVILLFVLLPRLGMLGAAVTSLIAYATACLADFYFVFQVSHLRLTRTGRIESRIPGPPGLIN